MDGRKFVKDDSFEESFEGFVDKHARLFIAICWSLISISLLLVLLSMWGF